MPPSASLWRTIFSHFFGLADEQCAFRRSLRVEVSTGDGRPTAFLRDRGDGAGVTGKEVIDGLLRRAI
jgi:hypothetical protein